MEFESDFSDGANSVKAITGGIVEAGAAHSLLQQSFEVDVRGDDLSTSGEAFRFGE